MDINRESDVLRRGIPYYVNQKRRTLDSDESSWSEMIGQLVAAKELKAPLSTEQFMDLTFVRKYYGSN